MALTVRIPKDYVPGSLAVRLAAYPSAIGQIEDGFESILREPTGCFEQTSTENYPNVLIARISPRAKVGQSRTDAAVQSAPAIGLLAAHVL